MDFRKNVKKMPLRGGWKVCEPSGGKWLGGRERSNEAAGGNIEYRPINLFPLSKFVRCLSNTRIQPGSGGGGVQSPDIFSKKIQGIFENSTKIHVKSSKSAPIAH